MDEVPYAVMAVGPYEQPVISEYATSYSQLEFPARVLPPIPAVSPYLTSHHDDDMYDTATVVTSGRDRHRSQISTETSSNAGSSLTERTQETSYSGLEPSTREPSPVPVTYDSMANTSIVASEVTGDIIYDEQQSDPDTSSYLTLVG